MEDVAYLYFIRQGNDGPFKIGVTTNPPGRLASIQTGNPYQLFIWHLIQYSSIEQAREDEAFLHNLFQHLKMCGEWFKPTNYFLSKLEFIFDEGVESLTEYKVPRSKLKDVNGVWKEIAPAIKELKRIAEGYLQEGDSTGYNFTRLGIYDLLQYLNSME